MSKPNGQLKEDTMSDSGSSQSDSDSGAIGLLANTASKSYRSMNIVNGDRIRFATSMSPNACRMLKRTCSNFLKDKPFKRGTVVKSIPLSEANKMILFKSIGFPAAAQFVLFNDWKCELKKRGKSIDGWRDKMSDLKGYKRKGCAMDGGEEKVRRMGPTGKRNKYALDTTKQVMNMAHGSFKKYSLVNGADRGDALMACKFPGTKRVQEARLRCLRELTPVQQIAFCKDQVYGADRPWSAPTPASESSSSSS